MVRSKVHGSECQMHLVSWRARNDDFRSVLMLWPQFGIETTHNCPRKWIFLFDKKKKMNDVVSRIWNYDHIGCQSKLRCCRNKSLPRPYMQLCHLIGLVNTYARMWGKWLDLIDAIDLARAGTQKTVTVSFSVFIGVFKSRLVFLCTHDCYYYYSK